MGGGRGLSRVPGTTLFLFFKDRPFYFWLEGRAWGRGGSESKMVHLLIKESVVNSEC